MNIEPKTRLFGVRISKPEMYVNVLPGRHRVWFGRLLKVRDTVHYLHIPSGITFQRFDWLRLRWKTVSTV